MWYYKDFLNIVYFSVFSVQVFFALFLTYFLN